MNGFTSSCRCLHFAKKAGTTGFGLVAVVVVLFTLLDDAAAQNPRRDSNRTSRGKEFYLAFLPNVHETAAGQSDSAYIFITCDQATQGLITYRNRFGQTISRAWTLPDPTQIFRFSLSYREIEVQGYNWEEGQSANPNSQGERIAPQSVRIMAANDVTVYGLNQGYLTSDAFLALPIQTLGREYVVISYKSDGAPFEPNRPQGSTPSQFAVLATEDNTEVRISPSAPTFVSRNANPRTVRLNRGDVYLVQADVTVERGSTDLTGSRVVADKPVVVYGSHQRAIIPQEFKGGGSADLATRDHLVEQLPSVDTWGKSLLLTTYPRSPFGELPNGTDIFRVLAAFDSTRVFLNGTQVATLDAGKFYEGQLTSSGLVTASDQVLVAQFRKTSSSGGAAGTPNRFNSDPFMMIVPTVEQYDNSYRFINPNPTNNNLLAIPDLVPRTNQIFNEHYVTIVAPNAGTGISSIRLDNNLVGGAAFQRIGNTPYSFANIRVDAGAHTARGDSAFGIYVYGYGFLNSYGYIGGGKLRIIAPDRDPPVMAGTAECFGFNGTVYDTLVTDSKLRSVEFEPTVLGNVRAERDNFTPFADSVKFRVRLVNQFQDGSTTLVARDSIGFVTRRTIAIPGFTVGAEGQGATGQPRVFNVSMPPGRSRALPITILNYGSTTQTLGAGFVLGANGQTLLFGVANATLLPTQLTQSCDSTPLRAFAGIGSRPIVAPSVRLEPARATTVTLSLDALRTGTCTLRLSVQNGCTTREVAIINVTVQDDTTRPTLATTRDDCARTVTVRVQDREPSISGLRSVEVFDLVNCTLTNLAPITSATLVSSQVQGVLSILDPRRDAIYAVRAVDSAGNADVLRDTLQGFTLQLVNASRDTVGQFGLQGITLMPSRTLTYRNVGLKPFTIDLWSPTTNIYFSLPTSQFPATIRPGETRSFTITFAPLENREYRDTIRLTRFCVDDVFLLTGTGKPLQRTQITRCNAEVQLTTSAAPLDFFMEQNFPNPASGQTAIRFTLAQVEPVQQRTTLTLYNGLGMVVEKLVDAVLPNGEVTVSINVSQLERGAYFYVLQSGSFRSTRQLLVSP